MYGPTCGFAAKGGSLTLIDCYIGSALGGTGGYADGMGAFDGNGYLGGAVSPGADGGDVRIYNCLAKLVLGGTGGDTEYDPNGAPGNGGNVYSFSTIIYAGGGVIDLGGTLIHP